MSNQTKNQAPISKQDMHTYLNYLLSGEVKDEKHAKELNRLSRRKVTLSDATVLTRVMMSQQDNTITQLMDAIQIQNKVLEKLGATEEMFNEAQEEYNAMIAEAQKELMKEAEAAAPKTEEEA